MIDLFDGFFVFCWVVFCEGSLAVKGYDRQETISSFIFVPCDRPQMGIGKFRGSFIEGVRLKT